MESRKALGCFLAVITSMLYTSLSYLSQDIESSTSPYLVTLVSYSVTIAWLPIALFRNCCETKKVTSRNKLTTWEMVRKSFVLGPVVWICYLACHYALDLTSASSVSILFSTCPVMTFILSVIMLKEEVRTFKIVSTLLSFIGSVMVVVADRDDEDGSKHEAIIGDILTLVSSLIWALFTVLMAMWIPESTSLLVQFGFNGLVCLAIFMPLFGVLVASGVMSAELSTANFGKLILKGFVAQYLADVLFVKSMQLTSPTLVAVGSNVGIPISIIVDSIFRHPAWRSSPLSTFSVLVGSILVISGFILISIFSENSPGYSIIDSASESSPEDTENEDSDNAMSPLCRAEL